MVDSTEATRGLGPKSKSGKNGIVIFCLSLVSGVLFALVLNNYFKGWFNPTSHFGTQPSTVSATSSDSGFPFKQTESRYQQEKAKLQEYVAGKESGGVAYALKLASDQDPEIRRMAARTLARYNTLESITTLRGLVNDASSPVRTTAITSLTTLQHRDGLHEVVINPKFSEADKMRAKLGLYLIAKAYNEPVSERRKYLKSLTQYAASGDEAPESFVAQQLFDMSAREAEVAALARRKLTDARNGHLIHFILSRSQSFSPSESSWMQSRLSSLLANRDDRIKQATLRNLGFFCVSKPWSLLGALITPKTSMGVFEEALRQLGKMADTESTHQLSRLRKTSGWPVQRKRLLDQTYLKVAHGVSAPSACKKTKLTAQMSSSKK